MHHHKLRLTPYCSDGRVLLVVYSIITDPVVGVSSVLSNFEEFIRPNIPEVTGGPGRR